MLSNQLIWWSKDIKKREKNLRIMARRKHSWSSFLPPAVLLSQVAPVGVYGCAWRVARRAAPLPHCADLSHTHSVTHTLHVTVHGIASAQHILTAFQRHFFTFHQRLASPNGSINHTGLFLNILRLPLK